jgi:hypothetical protein
MKVFLVACLAVAVMAESDPNLILAPGMYHSGLYPGMVGSPILSSVVSPFSYIQPSVKIMTEQEKKNDEKKVEITMKAAEELKKPIVTYSGIQTPFVSTYINPFQQVVVGPKVVQKNGEVESVLHKRDADADPLMYINQGIYGLPAFRSAFYNPATVVANKATFVNPFTGDITAKVSNDAILPTNYANKGRYFAQAPGTNTVHVAKREADPLTVVSSPFYSGLVNPVVSPVVYSSPIAHSIASPVVYSNHLVGSPVVGQPLVYSNNVAKTIAKPIAKNAALGMEGVLEGKTVADDAWQFTPNYAGKGMYEARTPGTEHRARRDADPLTIVRPAAGFYNYNYPTVVRSSFYNTYRPIVSSPVLRYI